jgi:GntR family transcriptional regulator
MRRPTRPRRCKVLRVAHRDRGGNRLALPQLIAGALRAQILAGPFRPGDRLETEPLLARRLGVSRSTLRSAIALLEDEGHVKRKHGSGTYVTARPVLRHDLGQNFSVTDMISGAGRRPGTAEMQADLVAAPADIAVELQVQPGTPLSRLRRVRTADGRRVVDSTDWARAKDLSPDELRQIAVGSIYAALAERGLGIQHGVARIEPAIAGRNLAARLSISPGTLLFALHQVDYMEAGRPVLASLEFHLADMFEFTIYRRGPRVVQEKARE